MAYEWKKELRSTFDSLIVSPSIILIIAYAGSLLARVGWLFDLGSHFIIQYFIGTCILAPTLLLLKKKHLAAITIIIGLASGGEIYSYHLQYFQPAASVHTMENTVSVVQYNRLAARFKHATVTDWLRKNPFDIVILQEANPSLSEAVSQLKDIYPYQLHEPRHHAFGMIILSQHKLDEAEKIKIGRTFAFKIKFEKYAGLPVTVYALHAMVPIGIMRDIELDSISRYIAQNQEERTIFMGDWNITPFSPHFTDILETTKLVHRDTSLYPVVTWPATFILPIFQIPIDQILFSPSLTLISKESGPAMGSDHYPLMATFGLPHQP